MRLTTSQLRRIIKEEVQHRILRNAVREALVGGADRRMSGGGIETAMTAGRSQTRQSQEVELLKRDIADQKAQIKKVKAGKMRGQDLVAMEDHLAELEAELESKLAAMKASPVKESFRSSMRGTRLSEGHARITEEEFAAWKSGDWGFVSESGEASAGGPAAAAGGKRDEAMQQLSNGMSALTAAQNLFQQIYGSSRGKNTAADLENILIKLDDIYANEM